MTVIIPVYNDAERLRLCLQALEAQTYPRANIEVVVIDNGSTDHFSDVVGTFPSVRLLHESARGSYAARNLGIASTDSDYVAFTDADCLPAEDWLEKAIAALEASHAPGAAGRIELFAAAPAAPTCAEVFELQHGFPQDDYIRTGHWGATANLIVRRSVLQAVGPFNRDLQSSGDREWGQRAHRAGYTLVYSPEPVVRHPARRTLRELWQKVSRVTRGTLTLEGLEDSPAVSQVRAVRRHVGRARLRLKAALHDDRIGTPGARAKYAVAVTVVTTAACAQTVARRAHAAGPQPSCRWHQRMKSGSSL